MDLHIRMIILKLLSDAWINDVWTMVVWPLHLQQYILNVCNIFSRFGWNILATSTSVFVLLQNEWLWLFSIIFGIDAYYSLEQLELPEMGIETTLAWNLHCHCLWNTDQNHPYLPGKGLVPIQGQVKLSLCHCWLPAAALVLYQWNPCASLPALRVLKMCSLYLHHAWLGTSTVVLFGWIGNISCMSRKENRRFHYFLVGFNAFNFLIYSSIKW